MYYRDYDEAEKEGSGDAFKLGIYAIVILIIIGFVLYFASFLGCDPAIHYCGAF